MICYVYQSNSLCGNFAYVLLHNYSLDFDQIRISILTLKNMKKSRGYGAQISETGVSVNHTFNAFGEFSMCHTSLPIT